MGYVINDYVTVQSWKDTDLIGSHGQAIRIFGENLVTPIMKHPVNSNGTFFVSTSGSKAGWSEAQDHADKIRLFMKWTRKQKLYTNVLWIHEHEEIERSEIVDKYEYTESKQND